MLAVVMGVLVTGCAPQTMLLRGMADQLASQGGADEEDLGLARDASAFYLTLSESVLVRTPDHIPLATAVAGGFVRYAYAFVAFDADRLESSDAKAAQRLRERAARMYLRGQRHAMKALAQRHPGLLAALADPRGNLPRLAVDEVALAYWAATGWGAHVALSKDRPDVVADLPQVVRLAALAWDREPDHDQGALATLMGSLEAARPGGSMPRAEQYFDRAVAAAQGRSAGPYVARAETLALPAGDRPAFEALLRQALEIGAAHPDLGNQVMRERARWLLDTADDRF